MLKRNIALAALFLLALGLVACDDPAEKGRAILDIQEINGGTPIQSDVLYNNGTDPAYVPEDIIPIVLSARPYNDFITGSEHFQIIVEKYSVVWTRTDGGTGNLPTRTENCHITVSVGKETNASFRLTTWGDKSGPVLSALRNTSNQISMRADIRFTGRELGTDKEVEFATSVTVNFADTVNQ